MRPNEKRKAGPDGRLQRAPARPRACVLRALARSARLCAPRACVLRALARSARLRAPRACVLRSLARSARLRAPRACVLRARALRASPLLRVSPPGVLPHV